MSVKPALTKQDWEYISEIPPLKPGDWFEYQFEHDDPAHDRLVIAAAMLHNQEFGFTREMVELVRRQIHFAQRAAEADCDVLAQREACPQCQEAVDREKARLAALAHLIEAKLPPEETP